MAQINLEMSKAPLSPESATVTHWISELGTATEREKSWSSVAQKVCDIYETEDKAENSFNILYANTETLLPALYSNCPIPVVKRRYNDKDPVGKIASMVLKRALAYQQDNNLDISYTFDDTMESVVMDALLPGRGVVRLKIEEKDGKAYVCRETVPWERFRHGYGRTWASVPWISFEHWLTEKEITTQFGAQFVDKVDFVDRMPIGVKGGDESDSNNSAQKLGKVKLACVNEIWDKQTKTVYFVSTHCPEAYLKKIEDPLKLSGFFPTPKPLVFFKRISGLIPIPVYSAYEEQAKELNLISVRINKLIAIMKVRGFYDATLEQLGTLMTLEDGQFMPLDNVASFKNGEGAVPDAFWFMPIQELVAVLQQLYTARDTIKQVIYEITGIADILRGASSASETATAQSIKDKWGSLRIKRWQKMVSYYARDLLRIMAELTAEHLTSDVLASMTLVQLPQAQDKQIAQAQLQQMQMQAQQGQEGNPEEIQKLQQMADATTWQEIEQLFRSDYLRSYSIDIETNTTLDSEASDDKQQMADFMNALSQFLSGIGPMVEKGSIKAAAANEILKIITRKYRFGEEIEEYLQVDEVAGGQAQVDELQGQLEEAQSGMESLQTKLTDAENQAMEGRYAQQSAERIAQVEQRASEAATVAKVELMLERHKAQVKDMIHDAEKVNQQVAVESITQANRDLQDLVDTTLAASQPQTADLL